MTIETIADTVKQLQNKYDETDPFRLAKAMKITVKLRPMGIYEGCCKGFFLISRRMNKKVIKKCCINDANFHCLRHSFATRCVEVGFDIKSFSSSEERTASAKSLTIFLIS